jgi:hypothetical protein
LAHLGALVEAGRGVAPSPARAQELYRQGAELGSALAMASLAALLEAGRGVPRDATQARRWYERAAALGLPRAINALGELHLAGVEAPRSIARARELFEEAAAGGDAAAMRNLALLHLNGQGVARDEAAARIWLEKAARLGDAQAQRHLTRIDDALQAGFASLGMQIAARRAACSQSCRSLHRAYVASVCEKHFLAAVPEERQRRDCIDLGLRLSGRCVGSCRQWAQLAEKPNACEACFEAFLRCSSAGQQRAPQERTPRELAGQELPSQELPSQELPRHDGGYAEIAQSCLARLAHCSPACPPQ